MQESSKLRELGNAKAKITINMIKRLVLVSGDPQTVSECDQNVKKFLQTLIPVPIHSTATSCQKTTIMTDTHDICPICACKFDSPYSLQQCGHIFCRSCLMDYFESHMDSTMTADAFTLCCPFNKCNVECLIRDIVSVLGSEKAALLAMIAFRIHIRRPENDLIQCSGNDCNQVAMYRFLNANFFFLFI
jgi:hypothetical protein